MLAYLDFSVSTTGMLTGVKVKQSHSAGEMPGHSEQTSAVEASRLHQRPVGGGSGVLAIFTTEHWLFRRKLSQRICTVKCCGGVHMLQIVGALGKVYVQPSVQVL